MRKIIVAGAGHGGLSAAIQLAKAGYDVTVYEQHKREGIGHDWHDCMTPKTFEQLGIEMPDESEYMLTPAMRYNPPSKKKQIWNGKQWMTGFISVDRKALYRQILKKCDEAGVKLCFETTVLGSVFDKEKLVGIRIKDKDGERVEKADLIIDAAGMNSPVRRSLRQCCGIKNCLTEAETFYVYRAYFENTSGKETEELYNVYLFHNDNPGMDWVISNTAFYDILIGSFIPLTDEIIEKAIADFREEYPFMGEKLLRGGYQARIPLLNPLSKYVYDNYAAVGDSAGMTEPMSGSGIDLSLRAGKILADTVIAIGDGEYTTEALWKYQYEYAKTNAHYYSDNNLRKMLEGLNGGIIDDFIVNEVITDKEISSGGLKIESVTEALQKAKGFIPHADILPGILTMMKRDGILKEVKETMPEEYSEEAFEVWKQLYEQL